MSAIAICHGTSGKHDGEIGPHCPLLLYAGDSDTALQAEQEHGEYRVTNRYYDGIIGASAYALEEAELDESPACVDCGAIIDHWEHKGVSA
jgi:hypothetical protein